uniref:Uncharacterized protein n=1 Tax=Anopheles atroparvus TaxID=41427 RepID=A0A182J9U2_ANOAO
MTTKHNIPNLKIATSKRFRDLRPTSLEKSQEVCRLRIYEVYAWGVPLVIASVAAILDQLPDSNDTYLRPRFGEAKCWFYEPASDRVPDDGKLHLHPAGIGKLPSNSDKAEIGGRVIFEFIIISQLSQLV